MNGIIFEDRVDLHVQVFRNDLVELAPDLADKFFITDFEIFHR